MNEDNWEKMEYFSLSQPIARAPDVPCVYLLFNDVELVYIGMTHSLRKRLYGHNITMNDTIVIGTERMHPLVFDSVYYVIVEKYRNLLKIENKYQRMYCPKFN